MRLRARDIGAVPYECNSMSSNAAGYREYLMPAVQAAAACGNLLLITG